MSWAWFEGSGGVAFRVLRLRWVYLIGFDGVVSRVSSLWGVFGLRLQWLAVQSLGTLGFRFHGFRVLRPLFGSLVEAAARRLTETELFWIYLAPKSMSNKGLLGCIWRFWAIVLHAVGVQVMMYRQPYAHSGSMLRKANLELKQTTPRS